MDEVLRQESAAKVHHAIAKLPPEFRFPLVLKEFGDLSVDEIAGILELKGATVKTRLHRGRLRVAREFSDSVPVHDAEVVPGQTCLDLIEVKQAALDRNLPFPMPDKEVCSLCRTVCQTLDSARDACSALASIEIPRVQSDEIANSLAG